MSEDKPRKRRGTSKKGSEGETKKKSPRTTSTKRTPGNARKAASQQRSTRRRSQKQKLDKHRIESEIEASKILIKPLATEKTIGMIERLNTLTFIVNANANKRAVKRATEQLYGVKVKKVRTLNSPLNTKKAFVRLHPEYKAQEIATRLGIL